MKVKNIYIGCTILVIILLVATSLTYLYLHIRRVQNSTTSYKNTSLNVVTSLEDNISGDSIWCGTFNIVWNELKDLSGNNIIFKEQSDIVDNLNKSTFNINYLSDNSYYKIYGYQTIELKEKIEKDIKEKFNENSDILNEFKWYDNNNNNIFLYAMLKKDFKFPIPFDELNKSTFNNYSNVKYFGIDKNSKNNLRNQVEVLYYNDYDNFAIKLLTKENDEVIIVKNPSGNSFIDIYNNIKNYSTNYQGDKNLKTNEYLSIPNIDFKTKVSFKEIENKEFTNINGEKIRINKTLQTINFSLDNKGGKLKSESGISTEKSSLANESNRLFNINKTFAIFLKEKHKNLPYFASLINDISNVQDQVKANN